MPELHRASICSSRAEREMLRQAMDDDGKKKGKWRRERERERVWYSMDFVAPGCLAKGGDAHFLGRKAPSGSVNSGLAAQLMGGMMWAALVDCGALQWALQRTCRRLQGSTGVFSAR